MIRSLLVDDESGAVNSLRNMLSQYCPQIQVCGVALTIQEAVEAASALRPDLVFLDIQMPPHGTGFDFLKQCQFTDFGIIFTTAHQKYAISAINQVQPWSYLIKPFSISDLKAAVAIAEEKICNHSLTAAGRQRLIIQDSRKGALVLLAEQIVFCKADGGFTDIFILRNSKLETITSSSNLGEYESQLPQLLFCRPHHSYLVNLNYIERFERTGRNGAIHFTVAGGIAYVSVSRMDNFIQALNAFTQRQQYSFPIVPRRAKGKRSST